MDYVKPELGKVKIHEKVWNFFSQAAYAAKWQKDYFEKEQAFMCLKCEHSQKVDMKPVLKAMISVGVEVPIQCDNCRASFEVTICVG